MKVPAIFFALLFSSAIIAQSSISGQVVNAASGTPLVGASVFINNSQKGTTTDGGGNFRLDNIGSGRYELIISNIGFETSVYPFNAAQLPLQVKIELKVKAQELPNVKLEPYELESWSKWGKTFLQYFIGTTDNAGRCTILNTDKIHFRYYRKSNRLVADADEPILIDNGALGYLVKYQLESFEINYEEGTTSFLGYPLFEDKTKAGKEPSKKVVREREEAYHGSLMHFMYSLYHNRLAEEKFEVVRMIHAVNLEKKRVVALYSPGGTYYGGSRSSGGTVVELSGNALRTASPDSERYYRTVARQPDYIDSLYTTPITIDSLLIKTEGGYKYIYFDNYLCITYKGETESHLYLETTFPGQRWRSGFQRSIISVPSGSQIAIDKVGNYFNPQDLFTSGYWGWSEKVAELLPLDYEPGKEN